MKKPLIYFCLLLTSISVYGETAATDQTSNQQAQKTVSALCGLSSNVKLSLPSGLAIHHHDGQTFVSWKDRAEAVAGQAYRYNIYRSSTAITTEADLQNAELIAKSVLNNSGQLFGHGFNHVNRIDPSKPMSITEEGGQALPLWSGLWVANTRVEGCAFYAVIATDIDGDNAESVEAGVNATSEAVAEQVSTLLPMKLYDADERDGPSIAYTRITGTPNLPLKIILHASNGAGGGAGAYGDYYLYFGKQSMGYQEGLPGVFSIEERRAGRDETQHLMLRNRDTIVRPDGNQGFETYWFGYIAEPTYANERFAYPFTESRLDWLIPWSIEKYQADPNHIYALGGSMGAWGSMTYAFRRANVFKAIYPDRPRMRQREITSLVSGLSRDVKATVSLPNGESWLDHHDSIKYAKAHAEDLPFVGWNVGRHDGFATWQEQIDMMNTMSEERHGFALAWNNGDHSGGSRARHVIQQWYPPEKFALNQSYPAFSNSSIDDDMGNGDPANGDLEGGINLGFDWSVAIDEAAIWEIEISNAIATAEMTVDVTPRRRQAFKPRPGDTLSYTDSEGGNGSIVVDEQGRITVIGLKIQPASSTVLTIRSSDTSDTVIVPDISGTSLANAQASLEALGISVTILFENSDSIPAGTIIRATPIPGSMIAIGSSVTLVVSLGQTIVPESDAGFLASVVLLLLGDEDPEPDGDSDGTPDAVDNCPLIANRNQQDADNNGVGDACETDTSLPSEIATLAPHTWTAISKNTLADVNPCVVRDECGYSAIEGQSGVLNDWTGGVFASEEGALGGLVVWGGGHNGYYGNEVYFFDLKTLAWTRKSDPTVGQTIGDPTTFGLDPTTCLFYDDNPIPVHTYDAITYVPTTRQFFMPQILETASRPPSNPDVGCRSTQGVVFNFRDASWTQLTLPTPVTQTYNITEYDKTRNVVWLWRHDWGVGGLAKYSVDTGQWEAYENDRTPSTHAQGAIDPIRDLLVVAEFQWTPEVGMHAKNLADPDAKRILLNTTGDTEIEDVSNSLLGFEWVPSLGKFVAWKSGSSLYYLTPPTSDWQTNAWVWEKVTLAGVAPPNPINGPGGKFQVAPELGIAFVVTKRDDAVYAIKLTQP